jgi:uncharacterized membrane protein (UPF0127 family)
MKHRHAVQDLAASLLFLLFVSWTTAASGRTGCPQPLERTSVAIGDKGLIVEIAATEPARRCGLAWRHELAADHGMLFVYRRPAMLRFWMRNTFVPLDIAFIDENWRIINIATMSPHEPFRIHSAQVPARYALETRAGWFARRGITAGTVVEATLPQRLTVD